MKAKIPTLKRKSILGRRQAEPSHVPEPPENWVGSLPEWQIYWALGTLGKREGVDFTYQSPKLGGRLAKGGAVIDFEFMNPPNLGINISSIYYHYVGAGRKQAEAMQRAQLEGMGLKMIYIDEADALRNPRFYTQEALNFVDHSRMGR